MFLFPFQITNFFVPEESLEGSSPSCHSAKKEPEVQRGLRLTWSLSSQVAELAIRDCRLQVPVQFYSKYMFSASSSLTPNAGGSAQILDWISSYPVTHEDG